MFKSHFLGCIQLNVKS